MLLPWAIDGLPGSGDEPPSADAPQLSQQPLTGLGGGETIREVHLTVYWQDGDQVEQVDLVTHVVSLGEGSGRDQRPQVEGVR